MQDNILFEDEHLLILNKPVGISVTPGPGNPFEQTVAGWLLGYLGDTLKQVGLEDRWGIVHRLDKDTSGVLVTAKTSNMLDHLVEQFRSQGIKKEYASLVWGDVLHTVSKKFTKQVVGDFVINAPIARHPKGFSKFVVSSDGKPAVTEFHIDELLHMQDREGILPVTLLTAFPKTGRTHQIRVHIKAFGHPVVGDKQYQSRTQFAISQRIIARQFLHAKTIEFEDLEGEIRRFEAPLAEDLEAVLESLITTVSSQEH